MSIARPPAAPPVGPQSRTHLAFIHLRHSHSMHWLSHPRTILITALAAAIAGVIGESSDASAVVHLLSVVCVIVGLVVVVLMVPGFGESGRDDV